MFFLIEYNRALGAIETLQRFTTEESSHAAVARLALELDRLHANLEREIVILEADSEEQLRRTHSRYFESLNQLANPDRVLDALNAA
jgi:hypothetical protein